MNRQPVRSAALRDASRHDWQALAVLVAVVAVEACLLGWLHGPWFLADSAFAWTGVPMIAVVAGWCWQIDRHRAAYRHVPVRWPLVACQMAAFIGLLAAVGWVSAQPARAALRDAASLLALGVPAAAWLLCSVAAVAPRPALTGALLGTTAASAAFGAAVVGNAYLTQRFWDSTGDATVRLVELLLAPFADGPVIRPEPFVVGTDTFSVSIEHKCSGFQGIGLVTTLLAGCLWWFRGILHFPQAFLLLPIGIVFIWLANLVRITALILVGIWISPAIAVDGFHSTAGWIAFVTVGLGIIYASSRMPFFTQPELLAAGGPGLGLAPASADAVAVHAADAAHHEPLTPACVVPFVAIGMITMLTQAFSGGSRGWLSWSRRWRSACCTARPGSRASWSGCSSPERSPGGDGSPTRSWPTRRPTRC